MSDLDTDFADAASAVADLPSDLGNEVKLRLYGLYKQATLGDVQGGRPGFTNPVGRAKHDAWAAVSGLSTDDAKAGYILLVGDLES